MSSTNVYLPSVLSELVQEYEGGFRTRESKIDIWTYDANTIRNMKYGSLVNVENIVGEKIYPWRLLATYDIKPGLWTATLGPSMIDVMGTITPFIIHRADFNVQSLPPLSVLAASINNVAPMTNVMLTSHLPIVPLAKAYTRNDMVKGEISKYTLQEYTQGRIRGRTSEGCEGKVLIDYEVEKEREGGDLAYTHISEQTYIVGNDAIILILVYRGEIENRIFDNIYTYVYRTQYIKYARAIEKKMTTGYRSAARKDDQVIIQGLTPEDSKYFPSLGLSNRATAIKFRKNEAGTGFNYALGDTVAGIFNWNPYVGGSNDDSLKDSPLRDDIINLFNAPEIIDRAYIRSDPKLSRLYMRILSEADENFNDVDIKDDGTYMIVRG